MKKRIISLSLAILCMISLVPTTAFASSFGNSNCLKNEESYPTPDSLTYAGENGFPVTIDGKEIDFKTVGVIELEDIRYTYGTSQTNYHPDTEKWFVCDDGIYRTAEGYIVVGSRDYEKGTIVFTPFGAGIVLDCCELSNVVCIYTNY